MGCLNLGFRAVGCGLLAVGLASVAVLWRIGGESDGPGALVFYIGAFVGLGGGWIVLSATRAALRSR